MTRERSSASCASNRASSTKAATFSGVRKKVGLTDAASANASPTRASTPSTGE